jgi:ankyrin repeat protein
MAGKQKRKRKLFNAVLVGDERRVKKQLERGASPNARDENGSTALYVASVQGEVWTVAALLAAGALPNAESGGDSEGTPLCGAASWGHRGVMRSLLAGGADPNLAEADGFTPLIWAARGGWYECSVDLLDAGADPNQADRGGRTPLHLAAQEGWLRVVRLLLEQGADPRVADEEGQTPWAAANAWIGKDIEAELRRRAREFSPEGSVIEVRHTISVEVAHPDCGGFGSKLECSHREIAAVLARAQGPTP